MFDRQEGQDDRIQSLYLELQARPGGQSLDSRITVHIIQDKVREQTLG